MIKIVINPATGRIEKVEFPPSDKETQSQAFSAYQALSEEIRRFSVRSAKIIRLERALGRIT
jgi:hypothetical protein